MEKDAAIYSFWNSFGLPAYLETSVPQGENAPDYPYITYELVSSSFDEPVVMTASVWYRSTSVIGVNAKSDEIGEYIGSGGVVIPCDGGKIWIVRGNPFYQAMGDDSDFLIKRNFISITVEYITEN